MSTTATTIARYNVITDGGSAPSYRDNEFAKIVARRDRAGVLSDIQVVVSWAGHEGRSTIDGTHTVDSLTENAGEFDGLLEAIVDADVAALTELIREATDAHTEAVDLSMEVVDYEAVAYTVAAALGEEPHGQTPTTRREAREWRDNLVPEDFVEIVPA